jgi:hypothetical protein
MALVTAKAVGGQAQALSDVESVADARAKLGLAANYAASINGEPAEDGDQLEDGMFLTFAPQVKGA